MLECGDHKYAPGGMICVHLANGASKVWLPVAKLDHFAERIEIENDWLCPECAKNWPYLQIDELAMVCIHCIRELQQDSGFNQ
jgi:hypothetical protein